MFRFVTIGTDGDERAAKFAVAFQHRFFRVGMPKTVFQTGSIDFQTFVVFDQVQQNWVDIFCVNFVGIKFIFIGAVTGDVIQMAYGIVGFHGF